MDRRTLLQGLSTTIALMGINSTVSAAANSLLQSPIPHSKDPFVALDATAQAELVRQGKVSPLELIDAAIARIEKLNPSINAVIHPMFELAREQAKNGKIPDGPFKGVPYLIKDLSDLDGQPLEYGSRLFKGNIANKDLGAVERAKQAGLIILGKTNTPEFGLMGSTEPLLHGSTHNPWDLMRHTGGSSGGAAAAVASGMVPFAHASDGGGSIRIPASVCGLVGLKPSRGRLYKVEGEDDRLSADIAVRLGVSRSVRDSARLLEISERKGDNQIFSPVGMVTGPSKKRLKIAMSTVNQFGVPADPDVTAAIENTAKLCADLGHEVVEAQPHVNAEEMLENFMALWSESAYKLSKNARLIGLTQFKWISAKEGLEPWTLGLAEWHAKQEGKNPGIVKRALEYFVTLEKTYDEFFSQYDIELTPVLRTVPVRLGEQRPDLNFDTLYDRIADYVTYTPQHNAAGTPAISLPLFQSAYGLPIGSQFAAGRGKERMLLELAYELEEALPWADRWAPNSAYYI